MPGESGLSFMFAEFRRKRKGNDGKEQAFFSIGQIGAWPKSEYECPEIC
jgi:hypothetical protein